MRKERRQRLVGEERMQLKRDNHKDVRKGGNQWGRYKQTKVGEKKDGKGENR